MIPFLQIFVQGAFMKIIRHIPESRKPRRRRHSSHAIRLWQAVSDIRSGEGVIRRSPKITLSRCVSGEGKLRRTESARYRPDIRDRTRCQMRVNCDGAAAYFIFSP